MDPWEFRYKNVVRPGDLDTKCTNLFQRNRFSRMFEAVKMLYASDRTGLTVRLKIVVLV